MVAQNTSRKFKGKIYNFYVKDKMTMSMLTNALNISIITYYSAHVHIVFWAAVYRRSIDPFHIVAYYKKKTGQDS